MEQGRNRARTSKERVDVLLVERGLAPSRERARAYVLAGVVYSGERRIEKAGDTLALDSPLEVRGADHAFVSRGGVKLEGALIAFGIEVEGRICADFGSSTGGFTDCLLQRGASRVHAIDVGKNLLHEKLRADVRVVVRESTNARHLTEESLGELVDVIVIDASFIGLGKLLPAALRVLTARGEIVAMVKPQFEAERGALKKGVVRDPLARQAAIDKVEAEARELGLSTTARCDSVLPGPEGNVEAFLLLRRIDHSAPGSGSGSTSSAM